MSKTSFTTAVWREPRKRIGGALNGAGRCDGACFAAGSRCSMQTLARVEFDLNVCLWRCPNGNRAAPIAVATCVDNSRGGDPGPRPEHILVHDSAEDATEERPEPVHPPVVEEAGGDRGAEPPPRTHRGPGEVPAKEPVDADGEPDRNRPQCLRGSPRIDRRREDDEHDEERHQQFKKHRSLGCDQVHGGGRQMEGGRKLRGPKPSQYEPTQKTSQELEGDNDRARVRPLMAGDDETEGHRGADLPAGDGAEGGRHHRDRECMTECGEENHGLVRRGRGEDGPCASDDESEPTNHLADALPPPAVFHRDARPGEGGWLFMAFYSSRRIINGRRGVTRCIPCSRGRNRGRSRT